ncbi:MAG: ABC transporter ATP-binding protein [Hyphomicrobiales bacterium]|nr:ABC transporter ATP-binding protein [Hyphomicrobiales bacterium]
MSGDAADELLRVDGLRAYYGRAQILFDVSLSVGRGEVVALMGRNGAGKSTTFKTLMGHLERSEGSAVFLGRSILGLPTYQIARLGLGYVPEDRRIFTELTVMENLSVGQRPARPELPPWTAESLFKIFPNLAEMRQRQASRMSGGEQQMLTVARTLMGNPLLVLLDEPSEGVSPVIVEGMVRMIQELKQHGVSILLSEQNVHFAEAVSDRAYVIEKGHIRFAGTMEELARREDIRRQYLTV